MRKIDLFTNKYSVSKTLRFKLIPQGKTNDFFRKEILDKDKVRDKLYENVKKYIDEYHKYFIDKVLGSMKNLDISTYAELYYKSSKTDDDKEAIKKESARLRKIISDSFKKHADYEQIKKPAKLIDKVLPEFLKDKKQIEEVEFFKSFGTYFEGFRENRENIYTDEEKSTAASYRSINDNLPKFLDNVKSFEKIIKVFSDSISENVASLFKIENYNCVLTQKAITEYNKVIGGYTLDDGTKVQGINELVNLHNQTCDKSDRLPLLTILYKQILSDRVSLSFIPEKFENDNAVLSAVSGFYDTVYSTAINPIKELLANIDQYNIDGIFVKKGVDITTISQRISGDWGLVEREWQQEYDAKLLGGKHPKSMSAHLKNREKAWKSIDAFSIQDLEKYLGENSVVDYYNKTLQEDINKIDECYLKALPLFSIDYSTKPKRLAKTDEDIELIKNLLDSIKTFEKNIKGLYVTDVMGKDSNFYGKFIEYYDILREIDRLYDKVRNHITQKPYSDEKIKLTFDNSQLLGGWDKNQEENKSSVLLRRNGLYYLGIMNKNYKKTFLSYPQTDSNGWEKMVYKLLPDPSKMLPKVFFAKANIDYYDPSKEILRIRESGSFKKGKDFSLSDCHKFIEFYQNSIRKNINWDVFGFEFKKPNEYNDITEFYKDVEEQGYKVEFEDISEDYIMEKVNNGELYLFQLYNKDFSEYSKGTPNLHTLYFKTLFTESNLANVIYKLNGGAEMFYRFASITEGETIVHSKNIPIKNKHPKNDKKTSTFDYDLIKDRRYTQDQFFLHVPITINANSEDKKYLNLDVRETIKNCPNNYIIGIDRGERHLVYITVIDENGTIVEQFSGNEIVNTYKGKEYKTNYNTLLSEKEKERMQARQDWATINNIKELKEGYVSQIVHKICELVVKYDAVIAMEDLEWGFKQGRSKVEKSVYQKFEKMLIDKLNLMIFKRLKNDEVGGLLRGYQLTEKFESFKKMTSQNGFIFYVDPYLTSKIDPITGFVNMLKLKYTNESDAKTLISKFKSISYDKVEDMFKFVFDYADFDGVVETKKTEWEVWTNADRIETTRDNLGKLVSRSINITAEWKALFDSMNIDYESNLKEQILSQTGKFFFEKLISLLRLTLQMRNSCANTDIDYMISPVRNVNGEFYDSRAYTDKSKLPSNADANGAYNIARKALWVIKQIKVTPEAELKALKPKVDKKEWLNYAQEV